MASNKKTRARKAKAEDKSSRWLTRFRTNIEKVFSTGDVPTHYVGGGQPYTRGKPSLGEQVRPHLRKVLGS